MNDPYYSPLVPPITEYGKKCRAEFEEKLTETHRLCADHISELFRNYSKSGNIYPCFNESVLMKLVKFFLKNKEIDYSI